MNLIEVLKLHSKNSFDSLQILFDTFSESDFLKTCNGFPIWQQFYHTINSIDRIFTDPDKYSFPGIHFDNIHMLENTSTKNISKNDLYEYFVFVRKNAENYISSISESDLYAISSRPDNGNTKLDHIIVQLRHMAFHFGYFHSCAKVLYGKTPEHILV